MDFSKKTNTKEIIFKIQKEVIDDNLVKKILSQITETKKTGLNMELVEEINSKLFIEALLNNKFKLFNLKNEILTYLCLILKDSFLKSHMNLSDFEQNKRELIRRKLYAL